MSEAADLSLSEQVAIADRESAAAATEKRAKSIGLAAGAVRYIIDKGGDEALQAIEEHSGIDGVTLDHLVTAAAVVEDVAANEQAVADGLRQGANLIREHGLPS